MLSFVKRYPKSSGAAGVAAAVAVAIPVYIKPWEGLVLTSHWDRFANIWDICYGETQGVGPGMEFTKEECDAKLLKRVTNDYATPLSICITNWSTLPVGVQAVTISLGYNIGVKAACGSTLVRKLNAGDLAGACRELPKWNKAGGKVVKGLTNRRNAEMAGCLKAIGA